MITLCNSTRFDTPLIAKAFGFKHGLLIGIEDGMFARHLLQTCDEMSLVAVDNYRDGYRQAMKMPSAILELNRYATRCQFMHMPVYTAFRSLIDRQMTFDFVCCDIPLRDYRVALLPLIEPVAMVCGYDGNARKFRRGRRMLLNMPYVNAFASSMDSTLCTTGGHFPAWWCVIDRRGKS